MKSLGNDQQKPDADPIDGGGICIPIVTTKSASLQAQVPTLDQLSHLKSPKVCLL